MRKLFANATVFHYFANQSVPKRVANKSAITTAVIQSATILALCAMQGSCRPAALSFVFSKETSLDELDALFTEDNCSKITIFENDNQYIHIGYSIRAELKRESVEITPASAIEEAVYEDRAIISMSQITYAEQQLLLLNEKNAMLEDCIVELAQTIYA